MVDAPSSTLPAAMSIAAARTMPTRSIAAVLVEALVLDGDERVGKVGRDLGELHDRPVLQVQPREQLAVRRDRPSSAAPPERVGGRDVRELLEPVQHEGVRGRASHAHDAGRSRRGRGGLT